MNNFQIIIILVQGLEDFEIKKLKKSIGDFGNKGGKLERLFHFLVKEKIKESSRVIKKIYGEENTMTVDSFRKLCQRFLEKIIEVISIEENFHINEGLYSDIFKMRIKVKKQIYIFQIISIKGVPTPWLINYLKDLIKICEKYEFIDDEIVFRRNLYVLLFTLNQTKQAEECKALIEQRCDYVKLLAKAEWYNWEYIYKVQYKSIDDRGLIDNLKSAIKELEGYWLSTKLNTINYIKLMMELQLSHFLEDYVLAEKIVYKIIDITENNVSIKLRSKMAQNYMNLAYTQFFLNKFPEALQNSRIAAKEIILPTIDINIYKEVEVFALIYLSDFTIAEQKLFDIISSGLHGNNPEQLSKRHLMMGFIKYLQGDYKKAFMHLQETKEVESDREGWNLGIRILNIYLTLSTEKVDLADQRINAMRKHIERTAKMRNLRKRDIVIFRILSHLSRSGFDFREVWEERQKDFQLLRSDESDYRWVPRSHELIIFDQWFEARVFGKKYVPVFPAPRIPADNTKPIGG